MLAGPIERDFSISRPPLPRSGAEQSEQTTKEKFPKPSSPPARSAQPSGRKWGRWGLGRWGSLFSFSGIDALRVYGELSFASVHFRQPLRPVAVLEMNDFFRRQIIFQTIITYLTNR